MNGRLYVRKPLEVIPFDEFVAQVGTAREYTWHDTQVEKMDNGEWCIRRSNGCIEYWRADMVLVYDGSVHFAPSDILLAYLPVPKPNERSCETLTENVPRCQPEQDPQSLLESLNGIETIALLAYIQDKGLRL